MGLRKIGLLSITIILATIYLSACGEDKDPVTFEDKSDELPDGITMATPNGGELKSAVEGPVRSALGEPEVNLDAYRLRIDGLVDSSYALSWEEIQDMPASYTDTMIMYCVEGWEVWGNWKGILIKDLLNKAHLQSDGEYILFESRDGYKTSLPISYVEKYNAMLAYQVNNSLLQKQDGFPLRLIAFGKYGYKWAKWVTKLSVLNESQLGYWEKLGYSDQANVSLNRRRFYEGDTLKALAY